MVLHKYLFGVCVGVCVCLCYGAIYFVFLFPFLLIKPSSGRKGFRYDCKDCLAWDSFSYLRLIPCSFEYYYTVFLCLLLVKFIFCCCIKASPNMVLRDALNSNERQFVFTSFFDGSFYSIHDSLFSEMSSCFPHFAPFFFAPLWNEIRKHEPAREKKIRDVKRQRVNVIA